MQIGMLRERKVVEDVHGDVETGEGGQCGGGEKKPRGCDEVEDVSKEISILLRLSLLRRFLQPFALFVQPPDNRRPVDKGINLEMYAEPKKYSGESYSPVQDSPE